MLQAFGKPPNWRNGIWDKKKTAQFLTLREFINRLQVKLGDDCIHIDEDFTLDAYGLRSIQDLFLPIEQTNKEDQDLLNENLSKIINYRAPTEEKFHPIKQYRDFNSTTTKEPSTKKYVLSKISEHKLEFELEEYERQPAPIMSLVEGDEYCPCCFGQLTLRAVNDLNRGKLVLCTVSRDAWIYQIPRLPEIVF